MKVNDKDILPMRVYKFSIRLNRDQLRKMQLQGLRRESKSRPRESSATLCQLSHEGRCLRAWHEF